MLIKNSITLLKEWVLVLERTNLIHKWCYELNFSHGFGMFHASLRQKDIPSIHCTLHSDSFIFLMINPSHSFLSFLHTDSKIPHIYMVFFFKLANNFAHFFKLLFECSRYSGSHIGTLSQI